MRSCASSSRHGGEAASVTPPSGYLSIWHGRIGSWKERYFTVDPAAGSMV
jgi:hypothetical protein